MPSLSPLISRLSGKTLDVSTKTDFELDVTVDVQLELGSSEEGEEKEQFDDQRREQEEEVCDEMDSLTGKSDNVMDSDDDESEPESELESVVQEDQEEPLDRRGSLIRGHSSADFNYAKNSLRQLVDGSSLFPAEAASDEFFSSPPPDGGASDGAAVIEEDADEVKVVNAASFGVRIVHEQFLRRGTLLGEGGFCNVSKAHLLDVATTPESGKGSKVKLKLWPQSLKSKQATPVSQVKDYAMKVVSPVAPTDHSFKFQRGIADLATEARYLSMISHENIIRLHGVSEGTLYESFNCREEGEADGNVEDEMATQLMNSSYQRKYGFYLLLDTLHETLTHRIEHTYIPQVLLRSTFMRSDAVRCSSRLTPNSPDIMIGQQKLSRNTVRDPSLLLAQRLTGMKGVASALQYLHDECNIVFRDLKPDNIGFHRKYHSRCKCGARKKKSDVDSYEECVCFEDIPKLFDFGLAREMKTKNLVSCPDPDDRTTYSYDLTNRVGTVRWMAPEVGRYRPYNQKADVYSFGLVLYQVASLVEPFDQLTVGEHEKEVWKGGLRPCTSAEEPKSDGIDMDNRDIVVNERNQILSARTKKCWPKDLRNLMEECWDADMTARPEMKEVWRRLDSLLNEMELDFSIEESESSKKPTKYLQSLSCGIPAPCRKMFRKVKTGRLFKKRNCDSARSTGLLA